MIVRETSPPERAGATSPPLRQLAAVAGIRVGTALALPALVEEPRYAEIAAREFDAVTPENALKWGPVHPAPDRWELGPADAVVAFGESRAMRVRGHALVWHEQLPDWVGARMTATRLHRVLGDHVRRLVGRYRGRIALWDVVNEAIAGDGRGLRRTVLQRRLGGGHVADAFHLAHAADPAARLFYNDHGAEAPGRKADAVHELLARLRAAGAPVHGVGLQMHVDAARPPDPQAVARNVARLAALGLAVEISEMDVRVASLPGDRGARLAVQRGVYRDLVAACLEVPGFQAVTVWGVADRHSWIDARWGADDPLLFDDEYRPKPAYDGLRDAIAACGRGASAGAASAGPPRDGDGGPGAPDVRARTASHTVASPTSADSSRAVASA
jgi:endo-1,4-beta-xylanase